MKKYIVELFPAKGAPSIHLLADESVEDVREQAFFLMGGPGYVDVYPVNRDRNYLLYLGEVE